MYKQQIHEMIGQIVAYRSQSMETALPVRIMDSQLWEIRKGPRWRVQISMEMRASHTGGVEIGYPVLALYAAHGEHKADREANERWLRETDITMEDLYNEDGFPKGDFFEGDFPKGVFAKGVFPKGVLPKGIILKVVSPRHLFQDLAKIMAEEKARNQKVDAEWKEQMSSFQHAAELAADLNARMLAMGMVSDDGGDIVRALNIGSKRVSVDVDILSSLLGLAAQVCKECESCGRPDALLPFSPDPSVRQMLCATCHPLVIA